MNFKKYLQIRKVNNKETTLNVLADEPIHHMVLEGKEGNPFKYEDLDKYN